MNTRFTILLVLLSFFLEASGQKVTLSGYVREKSTGEELVGASIYVEGQGSGTITNTYGFYSITVPQGEYEVLISFLGYKTITDHVKLSKSIKRNYYLETMAFTKDEVVISAKKSDKNVRDNIGMVKLEAKTIKELPTFMGEADVVKSIQLLPGVQSATEGSAGFYVRGGGPDQNLVILDEAVVYNASHLFGFFSVFNADAVKDINLIKGGMPAYYGGRLSSVLDITMKEGNMR